MKFSANAAGAMTWPSLAAAGRSLDRGFEFGPHHQLYFVKADASGRLQAPRGAWVCEVFIAGKRAGFIRPYVFQQDRAVFL